MTADFILDRLRQARHKGLATAQQPQTRKWFIEKIQRYHDQVISDREFREIINQLAEAKHPVCTTNRGYYYATSAEEMEPAIAYLVSYARDIERRIKSLRETQDALRGKDAELFEHPIVKSLQQNFGPLERVTA